MPGKDEPKKEVKNQEMVKKEQPRAEVGKVSMEHIKQAKQQPEAVIVPESDEEKRKLVKKDEKMELPRIAATYIDKSGKAHLKPDTTFPINEKINFLEPEALKELTAGGGGGELTHTVTVGEGYQAGTAKVAKEPAKGKKMDAQKKKKQVKGSRKTTGKSKSKQKQKQKSKSKSKSKSKPQPKENPKAPAKEDDKEQGK